MRLFDTRRDRPERFVADGPVHLYVCGVTPYDTTHLGHARTYLVFDVLVRHLSARGHQVRYVQNVTDVDDSILQRAEQLGEPYDRLGERFTRIYFEDLARLEVLPADRFPTASSAIPAMQEVIGRLLESGYAYRADGDVFFRVAASGHYGELSRLDRHQMLEITALQDDADLDDRRKEDPLDFALWRASRPGEPSWDSPWGPGRPGWHIECSVLALTHLEERIDIHGGGEDLVYPHHECEIVQSEAITGVRPFARFWVHVGLVRLDGEKMSKSEGNMVFVRDLLDKHPADALRLHLLGVPYRRPLDHRPEDLGRAAALADRLSEAARLPARVDGGPELDPRPEERRFLKALDDDLDTPEAIAALQELAERILRRRGAACGRAQRTLLHLGSVLGLSLNKARPLPSL